MAGLLTPKCQLRQDESKVVRLKHALHLKHKRRSQFAGQARVSNYQKKTPPLKRGLRKQRVCSP